MKTILFVCTANQCRSPMAEGLMRHKLEREGRADEIRAASAGVDALNGCRATGNAIHTMAERGIDIAAHRSRAITADILEDAALILTMERAHANAIRTLFPAHAPRVYLLTQMAGLDGDVDDPVGGTLERYNHTAQEIERLIETGYANMMQWVEGGSHE